MSFLRALGLCACVCLAFSVPNAAVESVNPGPNSDPVYQQLRNLTLSGESIAVNNLTLKRDAATFHLRSGTMCFVPPVEGKVTGAVFVGEGNMILNPPLESETRNLSRLTKEDEFSEKFSQAVFRFTDSTFETVKRAGTPAGSGCDPGILQQSQNVLRKRLRYNLTARILQDVLSPEPGSLFVAFVHGNRYNDKLLYAVDPHGVPAFAEFVYRDRPVALPLSPEEVVLMTYDDEKFGYWSVFHLVSEYKDGTASGAQKNNVLHIDHQQLDTIIEKNAHCEGRAATTVIAQVNGLRVLPFDLYRTLRVQSVTVGGVSIPFIQEDKNEDYQFFVILPKALARGDRITVVTTYEGKDAVTNEGNGNYFPVARENWFPTQAGSAFGEYTDYELTFHIPKGLKMSATGDLLSEKNEGNQAVTVWKSAVPVAGAGFNFGRFKQQESTMKSPDFLVQSLANEEPPDFLRPYVGRGALGSLSTVSMMKKPLAEAELSVGLYTEYFGSIPYKRLAMTQQTACNFGQSWPQLVWLPICSFFDSTQRHQFGLDFGDRGYWKIVAPHEVAHQWWGNTVGFNSYRDQWMSEGFAETSASLFVQLIEKDPHKFIQFWNDEREILLQKNAQGFRGIDAGALTMGYRAANTRTGVNITRDLIYPKGGYILHMVRMMMWDRRTGDDNFKALMRDFLKTYTNRAATTEDFKAMVEKHMTPEMDLAGNHRMDWFFDEYVYGTSLPNYKLDYSFGKDPAGETLFSLKITQSNVDGNFQMIVPVYLELDGGRVVNLGRARILGNSSLEQKISLKGLKGTPKRAMLNYYDDVLASP